MKYLNRLLATYPILNNFTQELSALPLDSLHRTLSRGQILKTPSESCLGFPFLLLGELTVTKLNEDGEETFLYRLQPGDVCHHAFRCIMDNQEYGIQVSAHKECELIIIPLQTFKDVFLTSLVFFRFLYSDLFKKLELSSLNKEQLLHESVEQRLNTYLLAKKGKTIKVTHEQIAMEIGTAREVVSRLLKQMEKDGVIKLHRGSIEIY